MSSFFTQEVAKKFAAFSGLYPRAIIELGRARVAVPPRPSVRLRVGHRLSSAVGMKVARIEYAE
jgi:hypothetical protein